MIEKRREGSRLASSDGRKGLQRELENAASPFEEAYGDVYQSIYLSILVDRERKRLSTLLGKRLKRGYQHPGEKEEEDEERGLSLSECKSTRLRRESGASGCFSSSLVASTFLRRFLCCIDTRGSDAPS